MIKVVSNENMRKSDKFTIENKISSRELMFKAGKAIYESVSWKGKIGICCGSGNNAGDGYVLASLLKENNYDVDIIILSEKFSDDGKYYFDLALEKCVKIIYLNDDYNKDLFKEYDILVDCIFGTGFKNELTGKYKDVISKINESKKYVVSVDINSGLNGDNGLASLCVHSNLTVSIGYYKTGHFLNMAKDVMKAKINREIGIELIENAYELIEENDIKKLFLERKNYSNKSTYGYIALMGGSKDYSGSIRLSLMANCAMRSGAGVVTVAVPESIEAVLSSKILESTILCMKDLDGHIKFDKETLDKIIAKNRVIAFGMGIKNNQDTKESLEYLLENYSKTLIIDADGLNALAESNSNLLQNAKCKVILTPHIKEFSRLTKLEIKEINQNPVAHAIYYAKNNKVIILLKGPTTIITDGEKVYLVDKGCAGMATAGSGDVLSGILAAIASYNENDLLLATAGAAYINGLAGELAQEEYGDISMIASDTVNKIGKAIKMVRTCTNINK